MMCLYYNIVHFGLEVVAGFKWIYTHLLYIYYSLLDLYIRFSPHLCVGFWRFRLCTGVRSSAPPPPPASRRLPPQYSHTTCSHTHNSHTTSSHTTLSHNLLTHNLMFVWQAWHLATSTFTLCGRRGTYGTGLALVALLVPAWRCGRRGCLRGRRGTWWHRPSLCVWVHRPDQKQKAPQTPVPPLGWQAGVVEAALSPSAAGVTRTFHTTTTEAHELVFNGHQLPYFTLRCAFWSYVSEWLARNMADRSAVWRRGRRSCLRGRRGTWRHPVSFATSILCSRCGTYGTYEKEYLATLLCRAINDWAANQRQCFLKPDVVDALCEDHSQVGVCKNPVPIHLVFHGHDPPWAMFSFHLKNDTRKKTDNVERWFW